MIFEAFFPCCALFVGGAVVVLRLVVDIFSDLASRPEKLRLSSLSLSPKVQNPYLVEEYRSVAEIKGGFNYH